MAEPKRSPRYYAGCDVGSTTGKAVILGELASDERDDSAGSPADGPADGVVPAGDGTWLRILASAILPSRLDPEETARAALDEALASVAVLEGQGLEGLTRVVGTGYGRCEVPFAHENISEITCHGVGVHAVAPAVRTLVDIGGQDVKAIALHEDGTVREFAMNDKCAAGTGRFFEAMARTFGLSLEEFSALSLGAERPVPVSSQCSVFAESEVISLLAQKKPPAGVAAGIQVAVGKRVFALARRVGVEPRLTLTGGCAHNAGLVPTLERLLREEILPLPVDAQLMGALGAAVLARRRT